MLRTQARYCHGAQVRQLGIQWPLIELVEVLKLRAWAMVALRVQQERVACHLAAVLLAVVAVEVQFP
jgi:hypothetical protein